MEERLPQCHSAGRITHLSERNTEASEGGLANVNVVYLNERLLDCLLYAGTWDKKNEKGTRRALNKVHTIVPMV